MSTHELPFNLDDMIARLRPWIETESPTFDASAVNRMVEVAAYDFAAAGATIEFIPGRMGFGGSLRARFPHKDQGKPGILVSGHLDTVHPLGVININPYRREDGKLYGPGIQDMKGGNFVALEAMREIARSGLATKLPVTFLLTPDEEVGTPSTRDLIEQEALKNKYVLVPEPALRDGGAVVGRYAIARYNLETVGKPSHAGWLLKEGRSAIRRMAEKLSRSKRSQQTIAPSRLESFMQANGSIASHQAVTPKRLAWPKRKRHGRRRCADHGAWRRQRWG